MFPLRITEVEQMVVSLPANAVVGFSLTVIDTSSIVGLQTPFEVVHSKIFVPTESPLTEEFAADGFAIVPLPATSVHIPVSIAGKFPLRITEVEQIAVSLPAFAVVGFALTMIDTSSIVCLQIPLEVVHSKIFVPTLNPLTEEFAVVGFAIVPVPATSVHIPVPI